MNCLIRRSGREQHVNRDREEREGKEGNGFFFNGIGPGRDDPPFHRPQCRVPRRVELMEFFFVHYSVLRFFIFYLLSDIPQFYTVLFVIILFYSIPPTYLRSTLRQWNPFSRESWARNLAGRDKERYLHGPRPYLCSWTILSTSTQYQIFNESTFISLLSTPYSLFQPISSSSISPMIDIAALRLLPRRQVDPFHLRGTRSRP